MPALFTKEIKNKDEEYLDLDSAGIIYPYVANKEWNSSYRIKARLKTQVDLTALKAAVETMKKRYPYFFMRLDIQSKKYVLKKGYNCDTVFKDDGLCKPFLLDGYEPLLRILYGENTISTEFFHALTDGHGALMFVGELLEEYSKEVLKNRRIPFTGEKGEALHPELNNTTDIYKELYKLGGKSVSRFLTYAYQFKDGNGKTLTAKSLEVSASELKAAAKKYSVSISVYLCALQTAAIFDTQAVGGKPVRISVPVDLRKYFDTASCRNAALYFLTSAKKNSFTHFSELVKRTEAQFSENLQKEKLRNLAYTNVKTAKFKLFEMLPILLKKLVLNIGFTAFGENQFTSTLTNLGVISLGNNARMLVDDISFILGRQKTKPLNLSVATYNGKTEITVSSTVNSENFVSALRARLAYDGVSSALRSEEVNKETVKTGLNKAS